MNNEWLALSIGIAAFGLLTVTLITGLFDAHLEARVRVHAQRMRTANSQLDHQASHDSLTDLPNRTLFLKVLQSQIDAGVLNGSDALLSVMLIDIDRFNVINDSLGHGVGEGVLQEVARRLRALTAEAGLAARLGGDEFLLLVPASDPKVIIQHANRVVASLAEVYAVDGVELHLSVSVGVTTHPFDRSPPDVLISHADEARYDAKHDGGNGFPVAMDDFGTGYSSMSYLKRLPVSKLKIDRSFVSDLGASAESDSIVAAVIALAHGLGMAVVAEGVETAAQLSILSGFGCDQYQGFLFSRPVAAEQVLGLLRAQAVPVGDVLEPTVTIELLEASA